MSEATPPSPNAPCPCGSGLKYKNCCQRNAAEAEVEQQEQNRSRTPLLIFAICALLTASVILAYQNQLIGDHDVPPPPTLPDGSTPTNGFYDAATNRHWDSAHGHWHDGPPPQGMAAQPAPAPSAEPVEVPAAPPVAYEDNFYDAANNRHWNAEHGHWHNGPPQAFTPMRPADVGMTESPDQSAPAPTQPATPTSPDAPADSAPQTPGEPDGQTQAAPETPAVPAAPPSPDDVTSPEAAYDENGDM